MEAQSLSTWLIVTGVFGAAGLLRGFTGFGFALVAVPFGALWMPPEALVPTVILLQIYVGAFEARSAIASCHRSSVLTLMAGGAVGTPFGVYTLILLPTKAVYATIGTIVLASCVLLLTKPLTHRLHQSVGAVAGVVAGVFNGMAAMPGPPAIFYFVRGGFSHTQTRSSLILFFFITSIYAICVTFYAGLLRKDEIVLSVVSLPVVALSTWVGAQLFHRFGSRWYRPVGIASLVGAAVAAFAKMISL